MEFGGSGSESDPIRLYIRPSRATGRPCLFHSFVGANRGYNESLMLPTQDLNVKQIVRLSTPRALKETLPAPEAANATVVAGRQAIRNILGPKDRACWSWWGRCLSIHDVQEGALDCIPRAD